MQVESPTSTTFPTSPVPLSPTSPDVSLSALANQDILPETITTALKNFKASLDLEGHIALNTQIDECLGLLAKWALAWTMAEKSRFLAMPRQMLGRKVATSLDNLATEVFKHAPAKSLPVWQECVRLFQSLAVDEPSLFRLKYARSAYKVRRYSEMIGLTLPGSGSVDVKKEPDNTLSVRPIPTRSGSLFTHLEAIPILSFSVEKFCADIIEGTFAEGSALIQLLKRRKARTGLKHEFLIMKALSATSGELWIRIDRAASQSGGFTIYSVSSLFPAKDSILIAKSEKELIEYSHEKADDKMIVTFPKVEHQRPGPTLKDLVSVLNVVQRVSPRYSLVNENCYFLASIIEEALTDMFDGVPSAPIGSRWSEEQAPKAREDVLSDLYMSS